MPLSYLSERERRQYEDQGYVLLQGVMPPGFLDEFDKAFVQLANEYAGRSFTSMHDPELLSYFQSHMDVESKVYNEIRRHPAIRDLASHQVLVQILTELWNGKPVGLLEKMILRIDMPNLVEEVAHWHQDHFYVKGNDQIPTLWIPLQDVFHENGCLLIQPGSHKLGVVDHPDRIGKRHLPSEDILKRFDPIEVPMKRGDVLLFHALLFHSGQLNQSDLIRYSFQFRYTPIGLPTDAGMGEVIPLSLAT
jgi:phytanoyl-CoA hydroxylase